MGAVSIRRHGDVMIKTRTGFQIPESALLARATLLHQGDNHSHTLSGGLALIGEAGGKKYLRVVEDTIADHPEHGRGPIPVGDYYVEIKTEYDHMAEEARNVID